MILFFVLLFIFILSFFGLFWVVRRINKEAEKKDGLGTLISVTIIFSIIITLAFSFILFVIIGSTSVVNHLFSLSLDTKELLIIGVSFFIYSITIDGVVEKIFEYMFKKSIVMIVVLTLSRVFSFYIIGLLINLEPTTNLTVSIGVSLILFIVDGLDFYKNKDVNQKD